MNDEGVVEQPRLNQVWFKKKLILYTRVSKYIEYSKVKFTNYKQVSQKKI